MPEAPAVWSTKSVRTAPPDAAAEVLRGPAQFGARAHLAGLPRPSPRGRYPAGDAAALASEAPEVPLARHQLNEVRCSGDLNCWSISRAASRVRTSIASCRGEAEGGARIPQRQCLHDTDAARTRGHRVAPWPVGAGYATVRRAHLLARRAAPDPARRV